MPWSRVKRGAARCALALLLACGWSVQAAAEPLLVMTREGVQHRFDVELADDDAERSRGLMFRRELADTAGMLFDFEREQPVGMWMKNTYIPLDMLFIDRRGRVVYIARQTEPHSLKTISARRPVRAVLEVRGGLTEERRIKRGDTIVHPVFSKRR